MGSNKLPYFPFYPDDYLEDPAVVQLDADAEGCYIRLLARSWKSPTPGVVFQGHVEELCGAHRLQEQYRTVWRMEFGDPGDLPTVDVIALERWKEVKEQLVVAFDTVSHPNHWVQRRMVAEYERLTKTLRARQAGAATTNASRSDGHRNGQRPVTVTVSGRSPTEEVEVEKEESKSPPTPPSPVGSDPVLDDPHPSANGKSRLRNLDRPGFNVFWKSYPDRNGVKAGKKPALAQWILLKLEDEPAFSDVMAGLARWKKSEQWKGGQFVPDAVRFLRNRMWEDDVADPDTSSAEGSHGW